MDAAQNRLRDSSDEALADLFRRGGRDSAEAFGLLLERIQPVLRAKVDSAARRAEHHAARDDLLQEAMLGFLSAVTAYRPGKGASFRTFVSVCAANRLESALREGSRLPVNKLPLDEFPEAALPPGCESMDPQDLYAAMEDARRLRDIMRRRLTHLERGVLERFVDGERYSAIAACLGVTPKAVDNALQRARKKLQRYL